ncbi:pectinesterase inhibitor-like [Benincasa hispida]|uniref:pectinesterase inhibitor-like n=1 Tax=Benincasa hispida TaxID=102211 RepID=UPI001900C1E9|nr:pectinesterase inhibitor-like [Benincasa hispida]
MNLLSSILPIIVLFALFSPAKPDAALIANLCCKTEQPKICSDCLNSGSGSQTADGLGLALIAIGCAEKNTKLMAQRLGGLVRSTPDSTLKTLLNDCWLSTGSAAGNFPGIARSVAAGDYAGGRNVLEITIRNANSCLDNFNKNPSVPVPSEVLAGTVAAAQDCRIISEILNNI